MTHTVVLAVQRTEGSSDCTDRSLDNMVALKREPEEEMKLYQVGLQGIEVEYCCFGPHRRSMRQ